MIQKPKFANDEELNKVKFELKKAYWNIRDAFKYYSSISSSTGSWTFALSLNSYTDYLKYSKVYKSKNITITDTDTLFFTTNKREKATTLNPGNALIRYQFLEIMMRLGLKYTKNDPAESIKSFTTEIIEKSLKLGRAQDFRVNRYWNESNDNVYRFHLDLLKEVYNNYSGALTKPGEDRYMSPGEFERIFIATNLFRPTFANRDVYVCFNMAMQSRVDEHTSDAHLKMTFIEFMEAIGRAADLISLAPPSDEIRDLYKQDLYNDETKTNRESPDKKETTIQLEKLDLDLEEDKNKEAVEMSEQEHINQPLHKKVDHLMPYLLAYCTSKSFKKKWKWPRRNPYTGFYTDVKENQVKEVETIMLKGINRLIFSKLNLKEIVRKKKINISDGDN